MNPTDLVFVVCGLAVLIASIGLVRFRGRGNTVYARIHVLGVFDVACIIVLLAIGQYLIALAYFLLTPVASHSIAKARYYGGGEL